MASDYRFSQALTARFIGLLLAALGVMVCVLTALVAVFSLPVAALTGGVVLTVVAMLVIGLALSRGPYVVRLDDAGYRVRFVRGAGVRQAHWRDVEDVVASTVAGERCVAIRLKDGRTTVVPVGVLAGSTDIFVADLQGHLNQGLGYRRIG